MIRVMSPNGRLVQVNRICPVCEKQLSFNGHRITIMQCAKDWSVKPTALAMELIDDCEALVVGNLKPEITLEIARTVGEKGYYDFSLLDYQTVEKFEDVVMDEGESAAYSNCFPDIVIENFYPFGSLNGLVGEQPVFYPDTDINWDMVRA